MVWGISWKSWVGHGITPVMSKEILPATFEISDLWFPQPFWQRLSYFKTDGQMDPKWIQTGFNMGSNECMLDCENHHGSLVDAKKRSALKQGPAAWSSLSPSEWHAHLRKLGTLSDRQPILRQTQSISLKKELNPHYTRQKKLLIKRKKSWRHRKLRKQVKSKT